MKNPNWQEADRLAMDMCVEFNCGKGLINQVVRVRLELCITGF